MFFGVRDVVEQDASADYTTSLAPDCSSCVSNELLGKEIAELVITVDTQMISLEQIIMMRSIVIISIVSVSPMTCKSY
jgi:hypothetical protein